MDKAKLKLLDNTHRKLIQICLSHDPIGDLESLLAPNLQGYGTAEDEVLHNREDFIAMILRQKTQQEGFDLSYREIPVFRNILDEKDLAFLVNEYEFTIASKEVSNTLMLRLNTIYEYKDGRWLMIQCHGSTPDADTYEGEAWPVEEWKRRNEELKKQVEEKTADLVRKNRELEIEASLEKIRAQSMGMQSSEDLSKVTSTMFEQMRLLGGDLFAFGIVLCDKYEDKVEQWHSIGNEGMLTPFTVPIDLDNIHRYRYDQWKAGVESFSIEIPSDYIQEHFDLMFALPSVKKVLEDFAEKGIQIEAPPWEIDYGASFKYGYLLVSSLKPFDEESIFPRFARVFEQAYTRFLDLKKAEEQAREAQIEAALERVRAASMAMHKTNELAQVVNVLFQQFSQLELDFYQVWINIFLLEEGISNCWFSPVEGVITEAYTAIVPLGPFEESSIKSWRAGEEFSHLSWKGRKNVDEVTKFLTEMTGHPSFVKIQEKKKMSRIEIVDCNHKYGVLAMAKNDDITDDDRSILKRFTKVFEQAYTRFLDLQIAEDQARLIKTEKECLEVALEELKSTQAQLIQSEKMASLGELTAGIAHEIQNPLNFVNNFSELNDELLEELKQEIEAGNYGEALDMIADLMANEEKIAHHGKRAESIVKAMLQHSRGSSGTKEPTDINALCDEYLRLAYHGMRARDKLFNAQFETNFDPKLPFINVDPQEMGRVILNLINNAFYAVSQKKQSSEDNYSPKVSIKTILISPLRGDKGGDFVEIRVTDNGPGIPSHIKDKIFQPFFTTKPTGQGTGLGLSLAYDIITKGHGGKLEVNSKKGEGTEFIISMSQDS